MEHVNEKPLFGDVIKIIRANKELSLRKFSQECNFSTAYMSDLEKNNRKPSFEVIKRIKENIFLTLEESDMLMKAFAHDRKEIPEEIVYYLLNNELIEQMLFLANLDPEGTHIRKLVNTLEASENE